MSPDLPPWADAVLSADLPRLRGSGESQHLEFKEHFPVNGRDLAKEIAAFASAGGGTILLGVDDEGSLVGIEADTLAQRDEHSQRLAGICTSSVKPSITPTLNWAVEESRAVLAIVVPEGSEPVYYASGVPYLRHLNTSRPAEPHEVVRLVLEHHGVDQVDAAPEWASRLASGLLPAILQGSEVDDRMVNPWLDRVIAQFKYTSEVLRDLLAGRKMPDEHVPAVKSLIVLCDRIASVHVEFGFGSVFIEDVMAAVREAEGLWERAIEPFQKDSSNLDEARQALGKCLNKLDDLLERAEEMLFRGRAEDFQSAASEVGHQVFAIGMLNLRAILPEIAMDVVVTGSRIHVLETTRLYMDGGQSQNALKSALAERRDQLAAHIERLVEPRAIANRVRSVD